MPEEGNAIAAEQHGEASGIKNKLLGMAVFQDGTICFVEDGGGLPTIKDGRAADLSLPGALGLFNPTTVFQDSHGNIWVGTQGGGAFRVDPKTNNFDRFDISNGMNSNTVICFGEDADGGVWIGTIDGGASVVSSNGVRTYDLNNGLHGRFRALRGPGPRRQPAHRNQ
ncbi:MAG: hypothetical protein IPP83_06050 [Flavobacteriales bacterium]|nr:hypothetical protein [Flavobacteriales bacterium]